MAAHPTAAGGSASARTPLLPLGAPTARADLLLAVGNGQFLSHPLDGGELVIGRDPECDFVIDHPTLSRRHAQVRIGGAASVQDLGSTNGTRVAGATLRGGDPVALTGPGSFEIGPFTFILVARRDGSAVSLSGGELLRITDPTPAGLPALVREFARSDASILICGETGVGKEVLAASLHDLSGRTGPLIQVNCAALNEALLESELFGYERGAFTGAVAQKTGLVEAAAGGTLFLDEIGELPLATQAKLLRVIERREVLRLGATRTIAVDLRFLAATNRDLPAEAARGAFRTDLLYRLDGVTLWIAPLRDRPGAIVPLALQFLAAVNARRDRATALSPEAVVALERHPWPGNVRELKAVIERAAVLAGTGNIAARHLSFTASRAGAHPGEPAPASPASPAPIAPDPVDPMSFLTAEQRADRARIVDALDACAGNQTRAAKQLGISRTTLITRLRIYKIPGPSGGRR